MAKQKIQSKKSTTKTTISFESPFSKSATATKSTKKSSTSTPKKNTTTTAKKSTGECPYCHRKL